MKILGLVTEYNPFHNGHLHHLQASKALTGADLTIAVMSGHFLQRGLPALTDKWTRAEMAIRCGVDLVVELPVIHACASAEYFASASVALLNALGADSLCFGSEGGAIGPFLSTARILAEEPPAFKDALRIHLDKGLSFPDAREKALQAVRISDGSLMRLPNNILGLEYCKAILTQGINMEPCTITRIGTGYHSKEIAGRICSATAIRNMIDSSADVPEFQPVMPENAASLMSSAYQAGNTTSENRLFLILKFLLRTLPTEKGLELADSEHGLWHRMTLAAKTALNYEDLIRKIKTRRYTQTRIQRVLTALLLDIRYETRERLGYPRYVRVLGTSGAGRSHLRAYKKHGSLPVINNLSRFQSDDSLLSEMLDYDILATDMFSLALKNPALRVSGKDHLVKSPYIGA